MNYHIGRTALAALALSLVSTAHAWNSSKVQYDAQGRLVYPEDANANRIPDFSHAGYKGGGVPLPTVPVRLTISPVEGDDTASIQAALDAVGAMPVQPDGYRGAVLLSAGVYDVAGTIRIRHSGVVLAGVGDGDDPSSNTILRRTGTSQANVIRAGGGGDDQFRTEVPGTRRNITTQRVAVGSRTFTVDSTAGLAVGDNIVVHHPSTAAWIAAMDNGGVTDANVWKPGEIDIRYHRYITAISGNTIAIDAPVFNHLDRGLSQSVIYKYDRTGMLANIGIEDLQVDIVTAGPTSETHCEDAIEFNEVEDSWIRDSTMKHFWHAGVQFAGSTRSTAERCRAIDPHSVVTGGRRYNFATYHSQLILFKDCYANDARHGYVANGTSSDSGNVVLNSVLERNYTFSEGHRRWSTGLLFDGIRNINRRNSDTLGFYNRGNFGTGHGWAVGHGVIWNCDAGGGKILVQQPPTAQNYAIGCFGNISVSGPFAGPPGYREGNNTPGLQPQSLYLEQLAQRQAGTPLDLQAPTAPALSSGGSTPTSALLNWTAATDNVGISGYDVFAGTKYVGTSTGASFTVSGLTSGTTYTFVVRARDAAGNVADSNAVSITTQGAPPPPERPTLFFEAENLTRTSGGANTSVATETFPSPSNSQVFASNFQYVSLGADGTPPPPNGEWIEFTLPNVPKGTYNIRLRYKSHPNNRGRMVLAVDGTPIGTELNQRSSPATFLERDFGVVRFAADGNRVVRLTITGKDSAAAQWGINADRFSLVPDNIAPVVAPLADRTVEETTPDGAVATFTGSATDDKDGSVPVVFTPASGSMFPLGSTLVVATAMDAMGNIGVNSFNLNVVDTTPPSLRLPANIIVEAAGPNGTSVGFVVSAQDLVDGEVGVALSHESGATFPLGTTTVTASAQDEFENTAQGTFTVTVRDTTPPVLPALPDLVVEATGTDGAAVPLNATARDLVSGDVPVTFTPAGGSRFALGTHTVTATARDAAGNAATRTFAVTVRDTTAPTIRQIVPSETELWPANHRMVRITVDVEVADAVDRSPVSRIVSISSDEPADAIGDGSTEPDWEITGDLTLRLRAERSGSGNGRTYTIVVESRDAAGNASTGSTAVFVPHSRAD